MAVEQSSGATTDFIDIARREGLLTEAAAAELTQISATRQSLPSQLAIQHGLLTPADVEIIDTLLKPRETIHGYEILGLLGRGGMGVVYRARQLSLGRIVALKTVMLDARTNPSRLSRFEQEAQTVGKLQHPHIITAYDFGRQEGRFFFAMELIDGEDVDQYIARSGPLSEELTWGLIRQAAAGLAEAAELGVVHRDIKPANLLLVKPPKGFPLPVGMPMVKIADFGLAFIQASAEEADQRTRLTADNTTVGSPHYMAPEQLKMAEVDFRADLYALGATAWHMLTGNPPFHGLAVPEIFARKLSGPPESLAQCRTGLAPETIVLVDELMARDPDQRIAHYAQLIDRIDAIQRRSGTSASVTSSFSTRATADVLPAKTDTAPVLSQQPVVAAGKTSFWTRLRLIAVSLAIVLLLGAGWAVLQGMRPASSRPPTGAADLKPTGMAIELFDGQSLRHWKPGSGNWQTKADDEGAVVLAAARGEIERPFGRDVTGQSVPMDFFRLKLNAALRQADSLEIMFGISQAGTANEARSVLRVESDRVSLIRVSPPQGVETTVKSAESLNLDRQRYYELRIDRQSRHWRAYFDDRWIGDVPITPGESPLFRLVVHSQGDDQLAYFADFVVEELAAPR